MTNQLKNTFARTASIRCRDRWHCSMVFL